MRDASPQTIHLSDYTPPAYLISTVVLDLDIRESMVTVHATLRIARNPAHGKDAAPLVLEGHDLELVSVAIDGRALDAAAYRLDEHHLSIARVPAGAFTLETVV